MRTNALALALALLFLVPAVDAQDEEAGGDGQPGPILLEKTIYVPLDEMGQILEKEGRSVYLPYEEFVELWRKGQPVPAPPEEDEPPVPVVLRSAGYAGTVQGDLARIEATLDLESLVAGWASVPLPFAGVAIEAVEVTGEGAVFATGPAGKGYALYLPSAGAYQARLTFSVAVEEGSGKKSIALTLPPAAIGKIEMTLPGTGLRVDAGAGRALSVEETDDGRTQVSIYLGAERDLTLGWMPTLEKSEDEGALLFASQLIRAHVGERSLRIETALTFEVLRGEVDTLSIETPAATRVISVEGENLREWGQEADGDVNRLWVRLHSALERKDTYDLALSFERILDETPAALDIPLPRTRDTLRESGHVVLGHDPGLDVRVTRAGGLSQLDPEDVPAPLASHLGVGFAYLAHPLDLSVAAERIRPVIRSETTSLVLLGQEEDVWTGWIDFEVEKAGVFGFTFAIDTSWSVDRVGTPETVEEFRTADEGTTRTVTVGLRSKALGKIRLPFRLTRLGTAARGVQTFAPPAVASTRQDRGLFGVSVPKKMEARTQARERMLDADREELFKSGLVANLGSEMSLPLAYRYREQPASVRLELIEKARRIDALASHLIEVTDGEVRVTCWLDVDVLYAPTDTLRFRAPSALDDELKIEVEGRSGQRRISTDGGLTLWEIQLAPPVLGSLTVTISHTHDLEDLVSGQSSAFEVPLVLPAGVESQSGFAAIRKEGTLEVATRPVDMEPIETVDLPARLRRGKIDSAFRYYAARPGLSLDLTRHDYQRLATAVVDRIAVRSVLTRSRKLRTKAVLVVQNTERQYLEIDLPPEVILGLTVDGRPQPARKATGGRTTLVEIPRSAGRGGTFEVVIDYEESLDDDEMGLLGSVGLATAHLAGDDVPVGRVDVELYLPPEYRYLAFDGNLEEAGRGGSTIGASFERLGQAFLGPPGSDRRHATGRQPTGGVPGDAIDVDLPTEGLVRRRFDTYAAEGRLDFWFVDRSLFALFDLLFLIAAAFGAYRLLGREEERRLATGLLLVGIPFVALTLVGGAIGEFLAAAFLGSTLVVVVQASRIGWQRAQETRAARREADPYLEEPMRVASPRPERPTEPHPEPGSDKAKFETEDLEPEEEDER